MLTTKYANYKMTFTDFVENLDRYNIATSTDGKMVDTFEGWEWEFGHYVLRHKLNNNIWNYELAAWCEDGTEVEPSYTRNIFQAWLWFIQY